MASSGEPPLLHMTTLTTAEKDLILRGDLHHEVQNESSEFRQTATNPTVGGSPKETQ